MAPANNHSFIETFKDEKKFKVIMDLCYMYFLQDTIFIWKLPLQDILVTLLGWCHHGFPVTLVLGAFNFGTTWMVRMRWTVNMLCELCFYYFIQGTASIIPSQLRLGFYDIDL